MNHRSFRRAGLAASLALLFGIAVAAPPSIATSEAIEAMTAAVSPPADAADSIVARKCSSCPQMLVRLTPESKFFVGRQEVDFATLTKYWLEPRSRALAIIYDSKALTVSRLLMEGDLAH